MNESMKKTPIIPFILVSSLFLMWGLANNMTDTLLAAFKRIMSMTDFQTSWIQFAFYGSYFCLAIPAALFIQRFSYKAGVLLGLGLFVSGSLLFYPASQTMVYAHFLIALFILAGGLSILETTANPYIMAMGPPETATRRLNFAQSFNPIGSITGVVLSKFFILAHLNQASAEERANMSPTELESIQAAELSAVMGPYVAVAGVLFLLWLIVLFYPMPKAAVEKFSTDIWGAVKRLVIRREYTEGVIAQFFYVGAQIGVWSFTIRYVMQQLSVNEEEASTYYVGALVLFMISRFVCTWAMKYIAAEKLLSGMALLAIMLCIPVIWIGGILGVYCLVTISMTMSLMFPTIFGLASAHLGDDIKIGGSGLIMAILGGAIITGLQGALSDYTGSIQMSYLVPALCFAYVAYYGYRVGRNLG